MLHNILPFPVLSSTIAGFNAASTTTIVHSSSLTRQSYLDEPALVISLTQEWSHITQHKRQANAISTDDRLQNVSHPPGSYERVITIKIFSSTAFYYNTVCWMSLTYPIIILAVDISPTVNKILHYTFTTSFCSSHMQGSHLMKG